MNKQCFKCRETKPLSEFYRHTAMGDGYLGKCKTCTKRDVSERERYLRFNDPRWTAKERARCREKTNRLRALGLVAPVTQATRDRWAQKNGHKIKAHRIASNAVRRGLLQKPTLCERCGAVPKRLEKHHPDYSRPLFVQWLCPSCHGLTKRKS